MMFNEAAKIQKTKKTKKIFAHSPAAFKEKNIVGTFIKRIDEAV